MSAFKEANPKNYQEQPNTAELIFKFLEENQDAYANVEKNTDGSTKVTVEKDFASVNVTFNEDRSETIDFRIQDIANYLNGLDNTDFHEKYSLLIQLFNTSSSEKFTSSENFFDELLQALNDEKCAYILDNIDTFESIAKLDEFKIPDITNDDIVAIPTGNIIDKNPHIFSLILKIRRRIMHPRLLYDELTELLIDKYYSISYLLGEYNTVIQSKEPQEQSSQQPQQSSLLQSLQKQSSELYKITLDKVSTIYDKYIGQYYNSLVSLQHQLDDTDNAIQKTIRKTMRDLFNLLFDHCFPTKQITRTQSNSGVYVVDPAHIAQLEEFIQIKKRMLVDMKNLEKNIHYSSDLDNLHIIQKDIEKLPKKYKDSLEALKILECNIKAEEIDSTKGVKRSGMSDKRIKELWKTANKAYQRLRFKKKKIGISRSMNKGIDKRSMDDSGVNYPGGKTRRKVRRNKKTKTKKRKANKKTKKRKTKSKRKTNKRKTNKRRNKK